MAVFREYHRIWCYNQNHGNIAYLAEEYPDGCPACRSVNLLLANIARLADDHRTLDEADLEWQSRS